MVGAKEFAINRKVIAAKEKNPLVEEIFMPSSMKSHERDIKNLTGSFLDKFKQNSFSMPKMIEHKEVMVKRFPKMDKLYNARSINPILEDSKGKKTTASKKPRQTDNNINNMFNIPPLFDFMRSNMEGRNKHVEYDEFNDLSDELANHITYKVFQNIKNYLDRDSNKPMGNRQIKVEISL